MSFPFGGHPTFGRYLAWARDNHSCVSQAGVAADSSGRSHSVTKISKPDGTTVIISGIAQTEHLTPSMISYLDRRLKLTSPWFSVDGEAGPL
jgi:hypothetical protein